MKRLLSWILIAALLCTGLGAFADEDMSAIFEYDADGCITRYYGGEYAYVPAEIDGVAIKKLGDELFFDLGVSSVYVEEGIETVGNSVFEGCNVESIDLPSTILSIGERAFANCAELTDLFLRQAHPSFGKDALIGTGYLNIYIPCTANQEEWKQSISRVKGDSNFELIEIHNMVESETEKDSYGEYIFYCTDCGFKSSKYEEPQNPFADVNENDWYYSYVLIAYNFGIIGGKGDGVFDPNAGLTLAEAAKIAACIHNYQGGGQTNFQQTGVNWYDTYVNYCYANGIIEDYIKFNWNKPATRAEMAYLFSRADREPYYVNEVPLTDIPDVYDTTPFAYEILDLYNKGVAAGSDQRYTYHPNSGIKRCEVATLITRILCYDMRILLPKG